MNRQEIQNMIRQEFNQNYNSGNPRIPPHRHDGIDNLKIKASDIVDLPSGGINGNQIFTTSGTFTVPSQVTQVKVTAIGGGQGGGRITSGPSVANPGFSGDYVQSIVDVSNLTTVAVTIGAGGSGRVSGSGDGSNGGDTSFGSLVVARGGNSATTSVGDLILTGFIAQIPDITLSATGSSTNVSRLSQAGGSNPLGEGGQGALGPSGSQSNGNDGQGYGSGASGGASGTAGGAGNGGNGSPGIIILEY